MCKKKESESAGLRRAHPNQSARRCGSLGWLMDRHSDSVKKKKKGRWLALVGRPNGLGLVRSLARSCARARAAASRGSDRGKERRAGCLGAGARAGAAPAREKKSSNCGRVPSNRTTSRKRGARAVRALALADGALIAGDETAARKKISRARARARSPPRERSGARVAEGEAGRGRRRALRRQTECGARASRPPAGGRPRETGHVQAGRRCQKRP